MAPEQIIGKIGLSAENMNREKVPTKCDFCGSKIQPVWGGGTAALKCVSCHWEMSVQEYSRLMRIEEQKQEEDFDEYGG